MAGDQQFVDQDLRVFRTLLLWLWDSHEKPWEYKNEKARAIYNEISLSYLSIGSTEELEGYLPTEENVRSEFPRRRYLYLNPIEDGTLVPIIAITSDFGRSIPELRIRLGLFSSQEGETRAFGYRFESPEGPGEHHYYHAQPINGFDAGESFLGVESWLPTRCPTFPLDANDPVKLLLSLLIALYGVLYISEVRHIFGIERYLEEMHFQELPELKWYRKVTIGAKGKSQIHVAPEPAEFEKKMRAKYPKCEIVGITNGAYQQYKAPPAKKPSRK